MFNIVDYPPGLGECSFCKKHTCGTKEDGTQQWLHSPIELHVGNDLTIGYQCAKMIMDGFGLTVEVVEKQILLTPTDEQIGDFVRKAVNSMPKLNAHDAYNQAHNETDELAKNIVGYVEDNSALVKQLNREQLKLYLKEKMIDFVPQWGDDRLREEALKHV